MLLVFFLMKKRDKKIIYIFSNNNKEFFDDDRVLGLKIYENGKLFIGEFDQKGKLNGNGLYINKTRNIFLGSFVESKMTAAMIYQTNDIIYEGRITNNFKKEGICEKEISPGCYEFIGEFKNNKKIKGELFALNNPYIRSIIFRDYHLLNNELIDNVLINFTNGYVYEGSIYKMKLFGRSKIYHIEKIFPNFKGNIVNNKRNGYGEYYWDKNEYYIGEFSENKLDNLNYNNNFPNYFNKESKYIVNIEKGQLVKFKKIDK